MKKNTLHKDRSDHEEHLSSHVNKKILDNFSYHTSFCQMKNFEFPEQ